MKRRNYRNAIRSLENARLWPDNLGVGKPYDEHIDSRVEDFLLATIAERQHKADEAATCYRKIIDRGAGGGSVSTDLLVAIALRKTGRYAEADGLAAGWAKDQSGPARWATALYNEDEETAAALMRERYSVEDTTPWERASGDAGFRLVSAVWEAIH
jgi:hypothetical protein